MFDGTTAKATMKRPIPDAALNQHIAVLGKTRSGKSSVMRGLAESLLERRQPVCIIDPKGDWWGIKLAADGKHSGFPVVIFGGEHADVPIDARAGAHVAELFATGNRPCLIDLGGWMVGDRTRFWIDFASALFRHVRGNRWLVVDEVHNFAPKGKIMDPDAGKALHWANRLASEGLGKGLHMIFASQRPQKVHNDTLTSAETLIAMRVLHPSDREAVADWIKGCGDMKLGNEVLASLAQMKRGEGWAWSPEIGFGPERIQFPMFSTYDSFKPQSADDVKGLKGWAEVDLEEVKKKLAVVVEEAKANDPKTLKAEIARLQRELTAKPAGAAYAAADVDAARAAGINEGREIGFAEGQKSILARLAVATADVERASTAIALAMTTLHAKPPKFQRVDIPHTPRAGTPTPAAPIRPSAPPPRPIRTAGPVGDEGLTGPQRHLLGALAWWQSMGHNQPRRPQVAAIAGWTPSGSNLRNRLAELAGKGLVAYPRDGLVSLTAEGAAAAPEPDANATMVDGIRKVLTGPQLVLFDKLLEIGAPVDRATLAEHVGWEPGGSNLRNRLSELKTLEVIDYPSSGMVELADWLAT